MQYTFEILGISPILQFFNWQQSSLQEKPPANVEYLSSHRCTLDAMLSSVEPAARDRRWDFDRAIQTVVDFWLNHADSIRYWHYRLEDAGANNLLIARLADTEGLRQEFELLLDRD